MQPKKILIILNDLSGGGAERIFVNIANDFLEKGIQVEFLLGRKTGIYFDILNPSVRVHELGAYNLYQYISKLGRFFKDHTYTHIFTASDYISVATIISKKRVKLSAKIIATLHYNLPYQLDILPLPQRTLLKFLNRNYIIKADEIVAVSEGVAEGFRQITGKKGQRVKVIYNPVYDDSIFDKAKETIPETNLFAKEKITLINIGRLEIQKNHALLIDAFEILTARIKNIQLLIIGKGTLENDIREIIKRKNLAEKIQLLGFRQNPFVYMARSNVFVLSSRYEGLPTVLIEALALGLNVASTDCPSGPAEILENGKYGWLAENGNAVSLAAAIEAAINHKHMAPILMERATRFHKKNVIPEYLNLLS